MDLASLESSLHDLPIAAIRFFAVTGSTNSDALQWAVENARDGSLVVAESQTLGRGRLGRQWITIPGASLAFSIIFRPTGDEMDHLTLFSPLGALAVCQAIKNHHHLIPLVKWPNDVLINNKKICGILAESASLGNQLNAIVLGIGVNIGRDSIPSQTKLLFPATCLESETGYKVDREYFLKEVLQALFFLRPLIGSEQFMKLWEDQLTFINKPVVLEQCNQSMESGILKGIDGQGNLILTLESGEEKTYPIGDLKLRPR
jgi:BirA family biotin operon repressor/biotin-[acetyl-CoA-carboxylase] ligase